MSKPVELIAAAPDPIDGSQRLYLVLPDDRKLPLPFQYRAEEFSLPGNLQVHCDGKLFALFDETTRTGAICDTLSQPAYWLLRQPIQRCEFFELMVPGVVAELSGRDGSGDQGRTAVG